MKRFLSSLLIFLPIHFFALGSVCFVSAADKPHIMIVLVDDMGYGDPGCFNSQSKIATPNIDSLARDGMRFTDAHAPGPLCHMSRYGLLTGEYPFRIDVTRWPSQPLIREDQTTIATLAKQAGYQTAMVGKWHVGFHETGYDKPLVGGPVDRGFETFFGIRASTDIPPYFYIRNDRAVNAPSEKIGANQSDGWSPIQGAFWRAGEIAPDLRLDEVLPRFTDEAINVIEGRDSDRPLMMYLAYPAPHTPWLPSPQFAGKSGASMYGDFLMMVDHEIGRVLASLAKSGIDDDTLVIFTSDNGPTWYQSDVEKYGHDSSGGFRGMKADAWEAGHRMPLIARWPGVVSAGSTSEQLVCFTDFLATFAELMQVELGPGAGPDSFSFLDALKGDSASDTKGKSHTAKRQDFVMRAGSVASMMTIRSGQWKLITGLGSGGFTKPNKIEPRPGDPIGQLYDLTSDPAETSNLYQQYPDIVARLTAEMNTVIDQGHSRSNSH